ncbi:DUF4194 domain-containing protein [Arthrobacter cryoconiti]|uniref:DUF4194 domain-containing protein n=1 Tax=Arthrobacter cryoconiti TaxID=748907 RepID=A0ABV8QWK2_9MICC|nr:DUF4194 domain-containing protein [Arthrobacter cryoconiti]MCC9067299.1 DUF4194 domain-containing protein [Arthrobacter cryoconiti]
MTLSDELAKDTHDAGAAPVPLSPARASHTPGDAATERALFAGDTGSFPLDMRQTLVRLLRGPYIDGAADPTLWTTILTNKASLQQYLSEIFLLLSIDPERKIAMLAPADIEAVHTQPIVARKPLRREETLLALRLRMLLDRHASTGTDVTITRSGAREILAEHRGPGSVDDKRLDEQTDSSLGRLVALKLLLPTELASEYRVSNALALALPFDSIDQIPAYLQALEPETAEDADIEADVATEENE